MSYSLIADSGVQFIRIMLDVGDFDDQHTMRFTTKVNPETFDLDFDYAVSSLESENIYSLGSLQKAGIAANIENPINEKDYSNLPNPVDEDYIFSVADLSEAIGMYRGHWISLPLFYKDLGGKTEYGPVNWARIKIGDFADESKKGVSTFKSTLLFDCNTQPDPDGDKNENPLFKTDDQQAITLGLCNVEEQLLKYTRESWNARELSRIAHDGNPPRGTNGVRYLALYLYLISWLRRTNILEQIKVFSKRNMINANVDMVIDVGNSRTCALLFDLRETDYVFSRAQRLQLNNLSGVYSPSQEPFSMRLAFHRAKFGEFPIDSRQFTWPSIVRLGEEAEDLIFNSKPSNLFGIPKINNHSSPKRYLWDEEKSEVEWEFIDDESGHALFMKGISNQFSSDGSLIDGGDFGIENRFSRKSLMTFCFIEIFAHAISQINSYAFRKENGGMNSPRNLRNIIITCPSAMSIEEQRSLRKCASDAVYALHRFYTNSYNSSFEDTPLKESIPNIIPNPKLIGKETLGPGSKNVWSYDEATCVQMVFLYSEIGKKYLNNFVEYFKTYGKVRKDNDGSSNPLTLTIGSLDIGAGTSDLMINTFKCEGEEMKNLHPINLYRESFNLAGDDLLNKLIQNEMIHGQLVSALRAINLSEEEIKMKLDTFFGSSSLMNVDGNRKRKDFNVQCSIPLAMKLLELSSQNADECKLSFEEIYIRSKPNLALLEYFHKHFGIEFQDIQWNFSPEKIDQIIKLVFDGLIRRVASVFYAYGCDFVLLAGRPTELRTVNELFLKYFPVAPNRLISLSNYRVGNWYPFQKKVGYFEDPKTIVSVGAMISYLAEQPQYMPGFNVKFDSLAKSPDSIAKYIGKYDTIRGTIPNVIISPEHDQFTIDVFSLPIVFGAKQINSEFYPSRPMFVLDFNYNGMKEKGKRSLENNYNPNSLAVEVDRQRNILLNKMPLKVKISRDKSEGLENLKIVEITDNQGGVISSRDIYLRLQTLPESAGHWMDTGILV